MYKRQHIGLIGANGEGKSTFMNIITGKMMPDEGKVEWSKNVRVGYLDQHTAVSYTHLHAESVRDRDLYRTFQELHRFYSAGISGEVYHRT